MARAGKVQFLIARSLVLVVLVAFQAAFLTKWTPTKWTPKPSVAQPTSSAGTQAPGLFPRIHSGIKSSTDTFAHCDFEAISNGRYSQSEACERAYMNGLHLDCMLRRPTCTASEFSNPTDLNAYGWSETVTYPMKIKVFHLDGAFQALRIDQDAASWAELNLEHQNDIASAPDGKTYKATQAQYRNYYNPKQGVLVASYNYGPDWMLSLSGVPSARSRAVPLKQWSDVTFLSTASFCQKKAAGSMRRLERVFRTNINNELTVTVLKAVIGKGSLGNGMGWPGLRLDIEDPRAKAVLGTPNGNGVAWLLAQHKQELGNKYVDHINVFDCWGSGGLWCIHFHIADVAT